MKVKENKNCRHCEGVPQDLSGTTAAISRIKTGLLRSFWSLAMTSGIMIFSFLSLPSAAHASSAAEVLEAIPVQHNGRVKPFSSFAREAALMILGKPRFEGQGASEIVWHWMADPEKWNAKPFIPVAYGPLAKEFALKVIKGRVSPEIILSEKSFLDEVQEASMRRDRKEKLSMLDQKRLDLYEKALLFREIGTGGVPGWIAHPDNPMAGWLPFQAFGSEESAKILTQNYPAEKTSEVTNRLKELLEAYRKDSRSADALDAASGFSSALRSLLDSRAVQLDEKVLGMELIYNRLHPFGWSWKLYLFAAVLGLAGFFLSRFRFGWLVWFLPFLAGFIFHTYGFYLRCVIAGRPPVTNMYESIIWVSWGVVFFSSVLFAIYRGWALPLTASAVAAFALVLGDSFPALLDPSISPLVPVLRSNFWLTIHVLTITLSYGAFLLAWGLGHAVIFQFAYGKSQPSTLSLYLYRALQIGVILLASGTVLGGVWANYSWGRFWGWDPKETWALIALLGYLIILHGRSAGWINNFGVGLGSVIAFLGVLMAWYGVNYVLAAGLHSYGFGGGGAPYVAAACLVDLAVISWAAIVYQSKNQKAVMASKP